MKLLIIISNYCQNGPANIVASIAGELSQKGHEIFIAADLQNKRNRLPFIRNVRYIDIPLDRKRVITWRGIGLLVQGYLQLSRLHRENTFELIHVHQRIPLIIGRLLGWRYKIPVLVTLHNIFNPLNLANWLYRLGDYWIAVSRSVQEHSIRKFKISNDRIFVINNGIDVGTVPDLTSDSRVPVAKEGFQILTVAGLRKQKALHRLILSAKKVIAAFPEAGFLIAGTGKLERKLKKLARRNKVADHVVFLGFQSNPEIWYRRADLFVLPSRYEGLPLALMEAMAAGLPCVATAAPGNNELVIDGVTGFLVPQNQPEEQIAAQLGDKIIELLKDPRKRESFGAAGRERVEEFSASRMVAENESIYLKIISLHKKISILEMIGSSNLAGTEKMMLNLITGLRQGDYQFYVVIPEEGRLAEECRKLTIPVFILPFRKENPFSVFRLRRLIKKLKINIIHTHDPRATFFARLSKKLTLRPIKIVTSVHCFLEYQPIRRWKKAVYQLLDRGMAGITDRFVPVSVHLKETLIAKYRLDAAKITWIPNGVTIPNYREIDAELQKYGIRIGYQKIVTICARLHPVKDHAFLLRSFAFLIKNYDIPAVLLIVGDGPLEKELKETAQALKLKDVVHFTGFKTDPGSYIKISDVCILTSIREGHPLFLIEAMALAKPVVAPNLPEMREVVAPGVTGILYNPGQESECAAALYQILADDVLRQKLGEEGYRRYQRHFCPDKILAQWNRIYLDLMKGSANE